MRYSEALEHVVQAAVNVGLTAVVDLRNLSDLPGVWVEPGAVEPSTLGGGWDAQVTVLAVVPNNGTAQAVDDLSDVVTRFASTGLPMSEVEFTRALLDNLSADPLPAIKFTTHLTLT